MKDPLAREPQGFLIARFNEETGKYVAVTRPMSLDELKAQGIAGDLCAAYLVVCGEAKVGFEFKQDDLKILEGPLNGPARASLHSSDSEEGSGGEQPGTLGSLRSESDSTAGASGNNRKRRPRKSVAKPGKASAA